MTSWSYNEQAFNETRRNLSLIKSFQMVATRNDPAVEQKRIMVFMQELNKIRSNDPNMGLCTFPAPMGHTYLVPTFVHKHPGSERWWAPYAMEALVRFLVEGKTMPIVYRTSAIDWKRTVGMFGSRHQRRLEMEDHCLPDSPRSVIGTELTILPSLQNTTGYYVAREGGTRTFAKVMFLGSAKHSVASSVWRTRQEEILLIGEHLLFVGRTSKNARIDGIFLLRKSATKISDKCIKIHVQELDLANPLLEEN